MRKGKREKVAWAAERYHTAVDTGINPHNMGAHDSNRFELAATLYFNNFFTFKRTSPCKQQWHVMFIKMSENNSQPLSVLVRENTVAYINF